MIIDAQQGFEDPRLGARNNPGAEDMIRELLAAWRQAELPVIHIQHSSTEPDSPLRPESPGFEFMQGIEPEGAELHFIKTVNSAFIGTKLEPRLRQRGMRELVFVGFTSDHCVSTSVRMARNLGFSPFLVEDACATFERQGPDGSHYSAYQIHAISLASLHGEFCQVVKAEQVLAAVLAAKE